MNTPHRLKDQLEEFVKMVETREAAAAQPLAGAIPPQDEVEERLVKIDKWHRPKGERDA